MSYFEDYKNERFHDDNLLKLIDYVTSKGKYEVITEGLIVNLPDIGT